MPAPTITRRRLLRSGLILLLALIGLYVLLPQIGSFQSSLKSLLHVQLWPLLLAVTAMVLTFPFAAYTYVQLATAKIRFDRTLVVQLAGMFINRLVPVGVGGLGINYVYLRTHRHSRSEALTVVGVNNALGVIGHMCLLILLYIYEPFTLGPNWRRYQDLYMIVIPVGLVLLYLFRRHLRLVAGSLKTIFKYYGQHKNRLLRALLSSIGLTSLTVSCFWLCCLAVGLHISFIATFIIFSGGVIASSVTPTPGGLGGVEAALTAGLIAAGARSADSLAAALLYRLVSYWLPLLYGSIGFAVLQRRNYVRWRW